MTSCPQIKGMTTAGISPFETFAPKNQLPNVLPRKKSRQNNARHLPPGVVLDSASRREANRGQSTNRKGEMSRASHQ